MIRSASAEWVGGLKDGKGTISTESGVLKTSPHGFRSRFESEPLTNPEELIAAAHAGCYSMALSAQLDGKGLKAAKIDTTAKVTLEKVGDGWEITSSHLVVSARIPGATPEAFSEVAEAAKNGCPVSKLLKAKITLDAKLIP